MPAFLTESTGTVSKLYFLCFYVCWGHQVYLLKQQVQILSRLATMLKTKTRMINEFGIQCSVLVHIWCALSAQLRLRCQQQRMSSLGGVQCRGGINSQFPTGPKGEHFLSSSPFGFPHKGPWHRSLLVWLSLPLVTYYFTARTKSSINLKQKISLTCL